MKKYTYFLLLLSVPCFLMAQDFASTIESHREEYKNDFLTNERSPLKTKEELAYLRFFEAKENYKVTCEFEATPDAESFEMGTFSGVTRTYVQYGWLKFNLNGESYKLAAYQNYKMRVVPKYKNYLFIPFKDLTNGDITYGGGRYLDIEATDIVDGKIELDFNKTYNPWCHYSDGYSCPIPPTDNHLKVAIEAGEKNYGKSKYD